MNIFRREVRPSEHDPEILFDARLADTNYVENFSFEWTQLEGWEDRSVISHGHVFGRFLLPRDYFRGKTLVDVGCGNGRLGRIVAPLAESYIGLDLSSSIYAYPKYTKRPNAFTLIRASGTDLPLADAIADVTLCWGVLHHMDDPDKGLDELLRVTKPGGSILIYVYPGNLDHRANLSQFMRGMPPETAHDVISRMSDTLDRWRDVDAFYAEMIANMLHMDFKHSRGLQQFQWYDGVTPRYHHSIHDHIVKRARDAGRKVMPTWPGAMVIER